MEKTLAKCAQVFSSLSRNARGGECDCGASLSLSAWLRLCLMLHNSSNAHVIIHHMASMGSISNHKYTAVDSSICCGKWVREYTNTQIPYYHSVPWMGVRVCGARFKWKCETRQSQKSIIFANMSRENQHKQKISVCSKIKHFHTHTHKLAQHTHVHYELNWIHYSFWHSHSDERIVIIHSYAVNLMNAIFQMLILLLLLLLFSCCCCCCCYYSKSSSVFS